MNDQTMLHLMYPISPTLIVRKNLKALTTLLVLLVLAGLVFSYLQGTPNALSGVEQLFIYKKALLLVTVFVVVATRAIYYFEYWRRYHFYLAGTRLFIEAGVFVRKEASVPLTFLSEFYLEQDWFDLLAGTRTLVLRTTAGEGQEVARIDALKHRDAERLRNRLITMATRGSSDQLGELRNAA